MGYMDLLKRVQGRSAKMTKGQELCLRKGWELGLFGLEKRRLREDFTTIYKYLKSVCKDNTGTFSGAHWQDKKLWAQTETQKFSSEHQEKINCKHDQAQVVQGSCVISSPGGTSFRV